MPENFRYKDHEGDECGASFEDQEPGQIGLMKLWANECCGLITVSSFGHENDMEEDWRQRKDDFKFINEQLKMSFGTWSESFYEPSQFSMMAILVDEQLPYWKEQLDKYGWFKTCSFYNPNTGNMCHQFMKILKTKGTYHVPRTI